MWLSLVRMPHLPRIDPVVRNAEGDAGRIFDHLAQRHLPRPCAIAGTRLFEPIKRRPSELIAHLSLHRRLVDEAEVLQLERDRKRRIVMPGEDRRHVVVQDEGCRPPRVYGAPPDVGFEAHALAATIASPIAAAWIVHNWLLLSLAI